MADSWHFGLIATCTTAAVAGPALHTSIQTHNFIQNWIEDAHDIWATQAQVDEDIQEEIQELKTAIKWVRDQLIDLQKQVILKCDWNSTQFCITPVQFNHRAYNWEQIKFHLQNIHDNASLNVQLLKKEIFEAFSKRLPSSTIGNFSSTTSWSIIWARPTRMVSKYYPQHRVWNYNFGDCLGNYICCLSLPFYKVG